MAQIGSPPAGWYTDPSGQHHARFWDGVTWTDQVRDDLGPASTPVAGGLTASGPGPVEEPVDWTTIDPSVTNPAAATVAGVAEAVAGVAEADLIRPGGDEPPLIVDYGTDVDPFGADPFAPSSVEVPAASFTQPSPQPSPQPSSEAPAFAAQPIAVAEPVGVVEAVAPAVGWYPDPTGRHQARLWDGTTWTERVADNGVEGFDPLPGATGNATATAGTTDLLDGAWSDQLVEAANTDPEFALVGTESAPLSAGQASLAQLPEAEPWEPETPTTVGRPGVKVRVAGGMILAGAVALLVGSAMPWMEVRGPRVGDASTSTGVGLGDGRITIILAIVLAVLGAGILTGRMSRVGGTKVGAMGAMVAGAAALAITAVDIADVADRAARLGVPPGAVTDVGTGLWLAFVGALLAVVGGLMAFANRR